ncbi:uncharacterized protein LOC131429591 isoform X2 [Malaya genurostris]|uniref:uncharacterized protein LOC131429591 isoform X2 n=1 Tax=Malaya genurostris TaxID=325434 RepID=UPI0026F386EA|nr:uncharacterized protein LOC131429591 isoform X2 [Malaya genurostris]
MEAFTNDTSGELNFLTPNSAKDIQREFTAGIKERCKIPVINCQAVTTVLDPVTGNISTVLTTTSPQTETATTAAASKKPSYLNLACCVNGYSNLTTYDSKLRQDINKSREVSPSRPIIATLHYNRSDGGNFQLTAPTLSYISMNNSINNNISNGRVGGMMNGTGRYGGGTGVVGSQDVTDNASMFNGNGFVGGLKSNVISSQSQISSVRENEKVVKKSFIQQRVEKLYGNAEGVVISKQIYNSNERKYLNNIANENVSKNYSNAIHLNGNGSVAPGAGGGIGLGGVGGSVVVGGGAGGYGNGGTKENLDENNKEIDDDPDMEALPVLRHLRPEFRAQLQLFSPKKVPKASPNRNVFGSNGTGASLECSNGHIVSNGSELSQQHSHSALPTSKSKVTSNGTTAKTLSSSSAPTIRTTTMDVTVAAGGVAKPYQQRIGPESDLSVVSSSIVTSKHCDEASVPTTVANNNIAPSATRESRSPITATKSVSVTEQTPVEKDPVPAEESNLVLENHQSQKMKLNHSAVVAINGDGDDNDTIVRNGTSGKNGHHHLREAIDDEKENLNGTTLEKTLAKSHVKDGNYFLQVLKNEQNRILTMAADVEKEAEALKADGFEISEEIAGYVLVAAGKARLLCTQKMKQFEGLCYNNLNQSPDEKFQTTSEDLRGFWDMLLLQVDKVDASFREIDTFRRNGWKQPAPRSPVPQTRSTKLVKRPFKSSATSASAATNGCAGSTNGTSNGTKTAAAATADAKKAAAAKRDAQRKQLMEMKRKQKMASSQQNVEIFVPGSAPAVIIASEATNGAAVVDTS